MRMLSRVITLTVLTLCSWAARADNAYPIVLVHGFFGWGPTEVFGLQYWGGGFSGVGDLASVLSNPKAYGYSQYVGTPTYVAQVGPISSNWDRAIELFYQTKGGCVDYGPHHSAHLAIIDANGQPTGTTSSHTRLLDGGTNADGSKRPRRCWFPGSDPRHRAGDGTPLYPQWGNDPSKKIHLVGHSLGGQTIRLLLQLLRNGSPEDVASDPALLNETQQSNPFTGGKNWVSSITSISTPHDGTTFANSVPSLAADVEEIVALAAAVAGKASDNAIYDFMLDQYGLQRNANEPFSGYVSRVQAASMWSSLKDTSAWDGGLEGAAELNTKIANFSDVYYFSWATDSTVRAPNGWAVPVPTTLVAFIPQSALIGCQTVNMPWYYLPVPCQNTNNTHWLSVDSSWWPNDSWVNTRSMIAPTAGAASPQVAYTGTPQIGVWNFLGTWYGWDHLDIIGMLSDKPIGTINPAYLSQAQILRSLDN